MVGGVLCVRVWVHRAPHPFFLLFCLLVLWGAGLCGGWDFTEGLGVLQGRWGLCGGYGVSLM